MRWTHASSYEEGSGNYGRIQGYYDIVYANNKSPTWGCLSKSASNVWLGGESCRQSLFKPLKPNDLNERIKLSQSWSFKCVKNFYCDISDYARLFQRNDEYACLRCHYQGHIMHNVLDQILITVRMWALFNGQNNWWLIKECFTH